MSKFLEELDHQIRLLTTARTLHLRAMALKDAALTPAPMDAGVLPMPLTFEPAAVEAAINEALEGEAIIEPSAPAPNLAALSAVAEIPEANQAGEEISHPAKTPAKIVTERKKATPRTKWTREALQARLVELRDAGEDMSCGAINRTHPSLYKYAAKFFGNYELACKACGIEFQRKIRGPKIKELPATPAPVAVSTPAVSTPVAPVAPTRRPIALPELQECGNGYYDDDPNRGLGGSSFAKAVS